MIGIDKIILRDLDIEEVNTEILKKNNFLVMQDNRASARMFTDGATGTETPINYINVSQKRNPEICFNDLKVGKRVFEGIKSVEYEHLNSTLPKVISSTKTNENNINNSEDLAEVVKRLEEELQVLGFGNVKLIDTKIKEIELNSNIALEQPFREYKRVFEYLRQLLPEGIKTEENSTHEPKGNYTGFKVGNGTVKLKFYNKRENILKKYDIDLEQELLRIEYSFLKEQKVKAIFGSNKFREVTEDFEVIQKAFNEALRDDLVNKVQVDIDRQIRHAIKHIRAYKGVRGISATNNYLKNYQAELFDIEIVLTALRDVEISNHYSRSSKETIASAEEVEGINLFGNINKLNEILEKLGFETIKLDMTKGIKKAVKEHY